MATADPELIQIRTRVNGEARSLTLDPRASAADVLREDLDLTGTKIVCAAGVCGACTVMIDGMPATACTLPACALADAELRTVEDMGRDIGGGLHPIQKAFLVHDGLQCGYCTPGFIVESISFFDRWRAKEGKTEPPRDAIAHALSGHLCRCGAYVGIYAAVAAACRGDFDGDALPDYPRHDGPQKVTGAARYTTDVRYPGMLTAKYLGSAHTHAKVLAMRFEAALAVEGVEAVLDVLDDPHRVARYAGQPIAAVAAVDEATAARALALIEVEYEPRPFVVDPYEALREGAPEVFPESKKHPANASEGPIPPATWEGNLRKPMLNKLLSSHKGRAHDKLARAQAGEDGLVLVEGTYHTAGQSHTSLEPHCCVARWTDEGLTVHTSTQSVHLLMQELAEHYRLKESQVLVHAEFVGGAFGGKQGLQLETTTAVDLARATGKAVRLVHDREEEMVFGGYRPLTRIELSAVTNAELEPLGLTMRAYGTAGVAVQSQAAPWVRMTYAGPKDLEDFDVTTNTSPGKPMRAPSGPPAFWALESLVDEVAHATGSDPVALRRKWDDSEVRRGLYDWAESLPEWQGRPKAGSQRGRMVSGVGLAIGNWFNAFHNATRVQLDAGPEGVVARCAVQDMGNGSRSVIAKAVGETLGLPLREVAVDLGASNLPPGPNSSASRTTASIYPTSLQAAEMLQAKLVAAAKKAGLRHPKYGLDAASGRGGIAHDGGFVPLSEFLRGLEAPIRVTSKRRGGNSTFDLLGAMPSGRMGISVYPKMTGSLAVVSVEVDTLLGRVYPRKVWLGLASGKIVNPELARSQAYGAVIQCLGAALTEERHYDPATGFLLSANLEDYRIPGIADIPPIEIFFDEGGFEGMKGGACGLSELAVLPTVAAVGNAVFNATGWRPRDVPLRPQRVQEHVAHLAHSSQEAG
ncbi:molybdopterin-dependent oxidoreductase [Plesiocystis pacifica]|uniref:molybdopterin-dependent oxidoreductase n=1 Tax=Plesiocystis pacifica TaxID=191768 RepID=UPI0005D483A9|nr:molybdopterin-dependent oxidoreductase [Plesiocystis pacifica]